MANDKAMASEAVLRAAEVLYRALEAFSKRSPAPGQIPADQQVPLTIKDFNRMRER